MAIKDDTSSNGWELDDAGNVGDRWVLEESEQQLADEWDLEGTPAPVGQWHPVEYEKQRRSGPAWILPTIVTVALLAVLGFSAYTLVPEIWERGREALQKIENPFSQSPNTGDPGVAAVSANEPITGTATVAQPVVAPPTAAEPTATLQPTPTLMPTLALPQHLFATVLSEYGVNLRSAPSLDAEIKDILDRDTTYVVLGKPDQDWLQLFVSDGPLEPGTPISGSVGYASSEFFAEGMQPMSDQVWLDVLKAVGIEPTATPAPPTPTSDAAPVEIALPTVTPVPDSAAAAEPAQEEPTVGATESGADTATDGEAVQATIAVTETETPVADMTQEASAEEATEETPTAEATEEAGVEGAAVAEVEAETTTEPTTEADATVDNVIEAAADVADDAAVLATPTQAADATAEADSAAGGEAAATATAGSAAWITNTQAAASINVVSASVAATDAVTNATTANVGVLVDAASGINVRTQPELDSDVVTLLADQAEAPAIGRFANNEWLLLDLGDGASGWVYAQLVQMDGDMESLPIITISDLPTPSPTLEPTPEPEASTESQVVEPPAPYSNQLPDGVPGAVIFSAAGVNARSEPFVGANVITVIPESAALPVTSRTSDDQWLQVELPQGGLAWVFRATILPRGNVNAVPVATGVVSEAPALADTTTADTTAAETAVEESAVTDAIDQTQDVAPQESAGTASASMRKVVVQVFASPNTESERIAQYSRNTVLTVTGQSADGLWFQVVTADGQTGWVDANSVVVSADAANVPVIG